MIPLICTAEAGDDLRFNSNGKFKIVIFSDTQDKYMVHQRLTDIMRQALAREAPDFVVFLGDQTEMNTTGADDTKRALEQILLPVTELSLPYGFVFGNHDDQNASGVTFTRDDIFPVYKQIGDCRTTNPNPSMTGTGTCNIPIYSSDSQKIAFNLWMIDSNPYQNMETRGDGFGCPKADQLQWLTETNNALTQQEGHVVPSLAFQHIAMPEIYNLLADGSGSNSKYGKIAQLNSNATGFIGELPCPCPLEKNSGEFNTLKSMCVQALFTGHDHLNDFTGTYDGFIMTAVPGMTYLNYGNEAVRGYGVIELDESDLSTYLYHTVKFSDLDAESGNVNYNPSTPPTELPENYIRDLAGNLDFSGNFFGGKCSVTKKNFPTVNLKEYDFIEFDIYLSCSNGSGAVRLYFLDDTYADANEGRGFYDFGVPVGMWTHIKVATTLFNCNYGMNGKLERTCGTLFESKQDSDSQHIVVANMCLTAD